MSKKHGKTNEPAFVYFRLEGRTAPELREFNFAAHEGRMAFLRFMSWAVGNQITVVVMHSLPTDSMVRFMNSEPGAPFDHKPSQTPEKFPS